MTNKNSLLRDAPERFILATLVESPNSYIAYPAFGRIVIHEFDIHGEPLILGWQQYCTDGTFGAAVRLGVASQCRWHEGFHVGARVGLSLEDKNKLVQKVYEKVSEVWF